jgi:hypothetical protein
MASARHTSQVPGRILFVAVVIFVAFESWKEEEPG